MRADKRVRVDHGHDSRRRREHDQRESASVEEGLELAEVEAEPDQGPQRTEAKDVQQQRDRPSPPASEPSPAGKLEPAMEGLGRALLRARQPQKGQRGPAK